MRLETLREIDPALYADMDYHLKSGEWTVAYDSPTALCLNWNRGWLHDVAAFDLAEAREILSQIPPEDALCLRGCAGLFELASGLGFNGCNPCRQAVYETTSPLPVRTELTIRHPDGYSILYWQRPIRFSTRSCRTFPRRIRRGKRRKR